MKGKKNIKKKENERVAGRGRKLKTGIKKGKNGRRRIIFDVSKRYNFSIF